MLSHRAAARANLSGISPLRPSSILSTHNREIAGGDGHGIRRQQRRTLLGLVGAVDRRVYRWARGVLPPISKTENIALGCGTIGERSLSSASFDLRIFADALRTRAS